MRSMPNKRAKFPLRPPQVCCCDVTGVAEGPVISSILCIFLSQRPLSKTALSLSPFPSTYFFLFLHLHSIALRSCVWVIQSNLVHPVIREAFHQLLTSVGVRSDVLVLVLIWMLYLVIECMQSHDNADDSNGMVLSLFFWFVRNFARMQICWLLPTYIIFVMLTEFDIWKLVIFLLGVLFFTLYYISHCNRARYEVD